MSVAYGALSAPAPLIPSLVLDWGALERIATARRDEYRAAQPFPHIVIDDLFRAHLLEQAIAELPGATANWTTYDTVNEAKQVCSDAAAFGPVAETIVHALNSAPFVSFLEKLTGIEGLIPDPHLRAAGYMKVRPGGFLGLHYDFATQKELKLDRRINVLLYLNRDWLPDWGGQLELHSNDALESPRHQEVAVEPIFNRLLIFSTPNALHGHRRPIQCPPGRARLCLSWYYYTAPPVPGWAARSKPVLFRGKFDPVRSMVTWANRLVPPILFDVARALRGRGRR
jgi:Rps23 Pro-64 3,4-dihydroxylase Tpa1-like proline 4-hydroxylase